MRLSGVEPVTHWVDITALGAGTQGLLPLQARKQAKGGGARQPVPGEGGAEAVRTELPVRTGPARRRPSRGAGSRL